MTIDQVREAILNSDLGARIADLNGFLQHIMRISDRADSLTGSTRAPAAITDSTPREQAELSAVRAMTLTSNDLRTIAAIASPGPAGLHEGDDRMVGLSFDWPWQLAFGLAPITLDSASLANLEPRGWLEVLLAQRALSSPFYIQMSENLPGDISGFTASIGPVRNGVDLTGDFSAGVTLTTPPFGVEWLGISAGNDYNLAVDDSFVAAGKALVIDAGALGVGDHISFDGSAETDGRFSFTGGAGSDFFFGGAGADRINGGAGADTLSGGGGGDVFVYRNPGDSSGADYDMLADFNPAADRIDLPGAVSGLGAAVIAGALSTATFDSDLAAALGNLGASQAVLFTPDAGDLAGQIFLVADGNGKAGYQAGEDFVIAIAGASLAELTAAPGLFI